MKDDQKPTLLSCIRELTPDEANPHTVAITCSLFVIEEWLRYNLDEHAMSDAMREDFAYLRSQAFSSHPDLRRVFDVTLRLADDIETRVDVTEGDAIKRLHALKRVLKERRAGL